jgi:twitching motility protein PilT
MQTVERIMTFFPPYQHDFIRLQLSQLLQGVISLRLLPTRDGAMRVPAVELMLATPTISELLLAGKFRELYKAIKEGAYYGTQTFNQSLRKLIEKDLISVEEALRAADSPDELKLELRGISKDTTKYAPAERFRSTRHPFHR